MPAGPAAVQNDRSLSRGRDFQSSGRGGAGNIRPSRDATPARASLHGPDDFSITRGREPVSVHDPSRVISVGRGGAGNIRSPSRDIDAARAPLAHERDVLRAAEHARTAHSSGRGGIGNIARSPSRSRSRPPGPAVHSTGRGGAGNIVPGDARAADEAALRDEVWAAEHVAPAGMHSTGRGGAANLRTGASPGVEHVQHEHEHEYESSGRGGAGNIRERSGEREREHAPLGHGIAALLHRVGRSGSRPRGDGGDGGRKEDGQGGRKEGE